jgi:hypothetical protein
MTKFLIRTWALILLAAVSSPVLWAQTAAAPANAAAAKKLGSIQKLGDSSFTLLTDQGAQVQAQIQPGARLVRLPAGQTDLKAATAIQFRELQLGDRVLVRGQLSDDGATISASAVIVMKQQDIAQLKQQELLDWQRRSIGGVVKQVDTASGAITLTVAGKSVAVITTSKTTYKRYSPDSVRWEDATAAKLEDIHPGDQLRAKGNKNEDSTQVAAEEIVAGTFRNIAGLITMIDPAQGTLTVQDLATKKPVTVKITADSQMKKLPAQIANGLAMRLKAGSSPAAAPQQTPPAGAPRAPAPDANRQRGDLNQLLGRLPAATLTDLQKGEAVMILSTQGSAAQQPVAITLLGGVEPLLTASPAGTGAQSFLTPWSLAGAPGGDQQ